MEQIIATWRRLDLRRQVILTVAVVLTGAAVLTLAQVATRPSMALLYSGLDPATAGEMIGSLEQMNVPLEVRGDAIFVAENSRDRVRLALAREGLPRQGQAGYELLDQISGFSSTSDMFNAAYLRAKEGELARTILAAPGVRAARVHIAEAAGRPFSRDTAGATASVTVTMATGALTTAHATAIRYLVALAVADLNPDQVAVIDSRVGMVLAPGTDAPAATADGDAAARETKLKGEIERLLSARVGRDGARVTVTVETDREAETVTEKIIQPDSRVTIHTDSEEISDNSTGSSASVTVASNLPEGEGGGDTSSTTRSETRERANYEYSEVQSQRVRQPGAIRRISVAVLVDGASTTAADGEVQWEQRPAEELAALRALVVAAIGYDEQRGDIVTVESMRFQANLTPGSIVETSTWMRLLERNMMTLIQILALTVVSLILGLVVVRPIITRPIASPSRPPLAIASTGGSIGSIPISGAPGAVAALPGATEPGNAPRQLTESANSMGEPGHIPDGEMLRLAVTERPEQTVSMLRDWLTPGDEEAA